MAGPEALAALCVQWALCGTAFAFVTGRHHAIDITWKRWVWALSALLGVAGFVFAVWGSTDGWSIGAAAWIRGFVGAAMLAAFTDVAILGRWYLRRPGLDRRPIIEAVRLGMGATVAFVALAVGPMIRVLTGSTDDGFGGMLGWFWIASVLTAAVLAVMADRALREPYDGAVMTATGISYLVVLCALGADLVVRFVI